ncbi:hypothetical protein CLHUN_27310 [Ruminiclostridium hungatei]|uniref:DUF4332 domain-containing protein n=1 Tax=Ruminiclostridium hungatei TaxID=48256 RepID=A0A1V4SIQ6_RUMHU|nr:DUF4332 domain-containing protein [Ruminiclostridium hungatei]OPX43386.1 hypothetical protein CLHUN_27310 [Ruminiclostridium hungatei]
MDYRMDTEKITLFEYKELLKKQNLLAGRRLIKNNIDERFQSMAQAGINNVKDLNEKLRNEPLIEELSGKSGIPVEYLMILKREIANIEPKPVLIADFPYISPPTFKKLGESCIQTSEDYFRISEGCSNPGAVNASTGISLEDAEELCVLCDLIRINGVGPVFSRILYEAGFTSVEEIANSSAGHIYNKTREINKINAFTRAIPEISEIQLCIDFAKLLLKN